MGSRGRNDSCRRTCAAPVRPHRGPPTMVSSHDGRAVRPRAWFHHHAQQPPSSHPAMTSSCMGFLTMPGGNDDSGPYAPWIHQHSR